MTVNDSRVDLHRSADDLRVRAEIAAPQLLAEHDDVLRAVLVLARGEEASGDRLGTEKVEPVGAHAHTLHAFGVAAVAYQIRRGAFHGREAGEVVSLRAKVDEIHRRRGVSVALLRIDYSNEMIRLRKRQWLKQHAVDDAEHGRVRAYAEREGHDRGDGEGGRRAELAHRVADVAHEIVHDVAPPLCGFDVSIDVSDVAARVVHVAEFVQRLLTGRVRREAGGDECVDAHVQMKAKLLVDVGADLSCAAPREAERSTRTGRSRHAGSRTLNTASA